jgi:hypothetical protein
MRATIPRIEKMVTSLEDKVECHGNGEARHLGRRKSTHLARLRSHVLQCGNEDYGPDDGAF